MFKTVLLIFCLVCLTFGKVIGQAKDSTLIILARGFDSIVRQDSVPKEYQIPMRAVSKKTLGGSFASCDIDMGYIYADSVKVLKKMSSIIWAYTAVERKGNQPTLIIKTSDGEIWYLQTMPEDAPFNFMLTASIPSAGIPGGITMYFCLLLD